MCEREGYVNSCCNIKALVDNDLVEKLGIFSLCNSSV